MLKCCSFWEVSNTVSQSSPRQFLTHWDEFYLSMYNRFKKLFWNCCSVFLANFTTNEAESLQMNYIFTNSNSGDSCHGQNFYLQKVSKHLKRTLISVQVSNATRFFSLALPDFLPQEKSKTDLCLWSLVCGRNGWMWLWLHIGCMHED